MSSYFYISYDNIPFNSRYKHTHSLTPPPTLPPARERQTDRERCGETERKRQTHTRTHTQRDLNVSSVEPGLVPK